VGCREGVTEIFNQGGRQTYLRLYHLSIRGVLSVGSSGLSCETSDVLSSLGVTAKGTLLLELCMKYAPASEYSRGRDRDCHSLVESWVDLEPEKGVRRASKRAISKIPTFTVGRVADDSKVSLVVPIDHMFCNY